MTGVTLSELLIDKVKIFYWHKQGHTKQLPIIMLHGHGGDHRGLLELAKSLSCDIYIPDLPGFGESQDLADHSMESYISSLQKLITALGIKKYNLAGHSLGSAIALSLAEKDKRVQKLILINSIPEFTMVIRHMLTLVAGTAGKLPEKVAHSFIHAGLYNLATFLLHSRRRTDITHARDYIKHQNAAKYSLKAWQEAGTAIYNMDQFAAARNVTAATLIIHGDKDRMTSLVAIESFAAHFQNSTVVTIAEGGHFLPLENVAATTNVINEFLAK